MPYTTAGKNKMLDALGVTYAAVFEGDPEGAGVRLDTQTISFSAASGGAIDSSSQPTFNIEAGETVDYVAYYDGDPDAAGVMVATDALTAEGPYGAAGTYQLTDSDLDLNA